MAAADADPCGESPSDRLAEARIQLLSCAQWLARVERSFGRIGPDEEPRLRWREDRNVIATHEFDKDVGLELRIDGLVMQFTEGGSPSDHDIDVEEHSPAHVEAWILIELLHRGLDRDRFSKALPYDTSAYLSGDGVEFSPGAYESELREFAAHYRRAAAVLKQAAAQGDGQPSLRISPRTLGMEATSRAGVIGFSLGDAAIDEPFYYVRADEGSLEPSRSAAAVLKMSDLASTRAEDAIAAFLASHGASSVRH